MIPSRPQILLFALSLYPFVTSSTALEPRAKTAYPDFVHPSNGDCTDYTVKSTVTYSELQWIQPPFNNNYDVVALLTNIATQAKVPFNPFSGAKNVTKSYQLAGTFCKPKTQNNGKQNTVLVATHGAGFDRRYWASSYKPEDYNFAQYALDAGYSVFYYDRLGVGLSSRVSGYEIEANPQTELLASLLKSLRAGKYTSNIKPSKLILVGHSFGTAISNFILGKYPELADAAVLTGYSFPNMTDPAFFTSAFGLSVFASRIVSTLPESSKPQFADSFDSGWVSFADKYSYTQSFLGAVDYSIPAAEYSYKITQPYSGVDFLSAFAEHTVADRFEGKVLLAPAGRDLFFCAGDCKDTFERGLQKDAFPKANITVWVQDGAGHGQNFAQNAKELYGQIVKFADEL
ncbi:hypothetical protein N0V90_012189 [Kalmusia sp. IMI 367209]|nr:hypothetical protein N0V90_012189 [Kalmusia sp. IMI 367209]